MTFRTSRIPTLNKLAEMKQMRLLCQKLQIQMTPVQWQQYKAAQLNARVLNARADDAIRKQTARVELGAA